MDRTLALLLSTCATLAACGDEPLSFGPEQAVAQERRPLVWGADDRARLLLPDVGRPQQSADSFTAPLPEGWRQLPSEPGRFRHLLWRIEDAPDSECYLTVDLRGGDVGNVGRWCEQFGLEPMSVAQVTALPQVNLLGRPARLVELRGTFTLRGAAQPDFGMLGLVTVSGDQVDTLKLTAPAAVIERERGRFLALAGGIRRVGAGAPGSAPTEPPRPVSPPDDGSHPAPAGGMVAGTVPEGWQALPGSGMRLLRYQVAPGVEAYVGRIGGALPDLLDVWRAEMQAAPLTAAERDALPLVPMLRGDGVLMELRGDWRGMGGEQPDAVLLVAARDRPDGVVFAKLVGPAALMESQRDAFRAFCAGLEESR